jgi:ABC transport system ATP-binding/permease protein
VSLVPPSLTHTLTHARALLQLRKELEWVRKQPKARQAKSKSRVEAFHLLKGKVDNPLRNYKGELALETTQTRLGSTILKFEDANLSFSKKILDDFSYEFEKGDRIGEQYSAVQ